MIIRINMALPSSRPRMTIELDDGSVEHLLVAHGTGSSDPTNKAYARYFSNEPNSHKTCLGRFVTGETYYGKYGYSLRIDGLDSTNDNARKRDIVIHPAPYVSEAVVRAQGYCGCTWGCFGIDPATSRHVIDLIKGGQIINVYNG